MTTDRTYTTIIIIRLLDNGDLVHVLPTKNAAGLKHPSVIYNVFKLWNVNYFVFENRLVFRRDVGVPIS